MIHKLLSLLFLLVMALVGQAQILKVNKGFIDSDSSDYRLGSIGMSFNINNRGATADDEIIFVGGYLSADWGYVGKRDAYLFIGNINGSKTTGSPLLSNGYAHARSIFLRKEVLAYEGFGQVQYDEGRNMVSRYLAGGGLRLRLIKKKKSRLHYGVGLMHEIENWRAFGADGGLLQKRINKVTTYLAGNIVFNDQTDFQIIAYYQAGLDQHDDIYRQRVSGDMQFSIDITKKLDFTVSFSYQYEDEPIIDIKEFVYAVSNGLKWTL